MSVDGTYDIVMKTLKGKETGRLVFKTQDTILTGTSDRQGETVELTEGSVEGDNFQFKVKVKSPFGRINVPFKGTVDGDRITGKAKTPLGSAPFEGTRVKTP